MNIFVVEEHPHDAAKALVDKHVVKMILETTQMISTVANSRSYPAPYRSTHAKHPCTIWAASHPSNMRWLFEHGFELCREYTHRYTKTHACEKHLIELWNNISKWWPEVKFSAYADHTRFPQAMPEQFKGSCPVTAYRTYYRSAKAHIAKWKDASRKPEWY